MKAKMRGFTLLEILMVLVIIGMMGALLFAASGSAREKSRQAVCVSNLKQIYTAMQLYRQDCDGIDPVEGVKIPYSEMGLPGEAGTLEFYENYVKNDAVLKCPDWIPLVPNQKTMCTYSWCFGPDEDQGYIKSSAVMAKIGLQAPMFSCEEHNPPYDPKNAPRWTPKRILILRFNGSVAAKQVTIRDFYPWEPFEPNN